MKDLTILNKSFLKIVVKRVITKLLLKIPFLSLWPLSLIVENSLYFLLKKVFYWSDIFINDQNVENSVENSVDKLESASNTLQKTEHNNNLTKDELDAIDKDFIHKFTNLVEF